MNLSKHIDYFNPVKSNKDIHIIGCGALGSNLAHILIRLGFTSLILYDFDILANHNITNQFFKVNQNNTKKTEALKENLLEINPDATILIEDKYIEQKLYDIVFLTVDSIETRKRIVELNKDNFSIDFLSDIRLGLEEGQCYTGSRGDFDKLLSTMQFKNGESKAPRNACGSTLTLMPTVNIITSLAVTNLMNYIKTGKFNYAIFIDSINMITTKYK